MNCYLGGSNKNNAIGWYRTVYIVINSKLTITNRMLSRGNEHGYTLLCGGKFGVYLRRKSTELFVKSNRFYRDFYSYGSNYWRIKTAKFYLTYIENGHFSVSCIYKNGHFSRRIFVLVIYFSLVTSWK